VEKIYHIDPAVKDIRGEIHNLFEGPIEHVALITSKAETVRGNHYHQEDHEYMYLISGGYESHSVDVKNPEKNQVLQVEPGDLIERPPYIAHAQKFTKNSVLIEFSTRRRDQGNYETDSIAYEVTEGHMNPNLKKHKKD